MNTRGSIAVFDLDGTITRSDSFLQFLAMALAQRPRRALALWPLPLDGLAFLVRRDRGALKGALIARALGGSSRAEVAALAEHFCATYPARELRPGALAAIAAHRAAGDRLVLLSASPDLYVPRLGARLGFAETVCSEVLWQGDRLVGRLASPNRRGAEKARVITALRAQAPAARLVAYGNARSDLAHLRLVDEPHVVNAAAATRRAARRLGLPVEDWP